MSAGVQLTFVGALPFDPAELAKVGIIERGRLYAQLGLDHFQRQAAEEAVRAVIRGDYLRRAT